MDWLLLYDFITQSVKCKLNAHSDEIQSIVWIKLQQQQQQQQQQSADHQALLSFVSSSKDKTIKVWKQASHESLDSGFSVLHNLNPSGNKSSAATSNASKQSGNTADKNRVWLTLCWSPETPNYLVTSSLGADLLVWNLTLPKPLGERFPGSHHQRTIFNITACPFEGNEISINTAVRHPPLITTSMDRNMIYWEPNNKVKWKITALGGFVYCITSSCYSPKTLVIGCGDNIIRQWSPDLDDISETNNNNNNINNSITDVYETKSYWKGIQSKITAIDIHPVKTSQLAFGLDDGRVGIYDTERNTSSFFPGAHKKEIYEIQWRSMNESGNSNSSSSNYRIYSLGNGEIFEWNPEKIDQPFKNINDVIRFENGIKDQSRSAGAKSEFCWNANAELVIVSTQTGQLELYDSKFKLLTTMKHHKQLINRIRWNPHPSKSDYFATASLDKTIGIFRLIRSYQQQTTTTTTNDDIKDTTTTTTTIPTTIFQIELVGCFKNHRAAVFGISWSPHDENLLVSCSADCTAQVWNIETMQPIANIRGHDGRVLTVHWSHIYRDVVFTGGEDQTVRMWDYTQQPFKIPPTEKLVKKDKLLKPITETTTPTPSNTDSQIATNDDNNTDNKSTLSTEQSTNITNPPSTTTTQIQTPSVSTPSTAVKNNNLQQKKSKVILPLLYKSTTSSKDEQSIINLAKTIKSMNDNGQPLLAEDSNAKSGVEPAGNINDTVFATGDVRTLDREGTRSLCVAEHVVGQFEIGTATHCQARSAQCSLRCTLCTVRT
ncbi:component of gems 5 [Heterostelium album PN500]|uniref:Component of gems 5 n=1 Tax=Heterostelium pallidum (strain ATCC 26659 / Pp 5 / PN500) TaxID=670386 RepID=D3AWS3_HETP5|nr:component of gems 5 [Heterostelium album PN500]EFA86746.1 component of gems 5 [Heterostelium album PN500]|eukprot:XP_020438850.1 component of gems 5 [Heterostelium album PN500]